MKGRVGEARLREYVCEIHIFDQLMMFEHMHDASVRIVKLLGVILSCRLRSFMHLEVKAFGGRKFFLGRAHSIILFHVGVHVASAAR